jgi:polyphenol oxidase
MQIIKSELFKQFPEIIFGFNTKIGLNRPAPFYFNMSLTVGDEEKVVRENREYFFNQLGLTIQNVAIQKQIHSDIITETNQGGLIGESDALITKQRGIGLAISSADCVPVFIYDKLNKVIAGVHSGWRGTQKQILKKTLVKLRSCFNSEPENLFVFIGPSVSQKNYEVGKEVADQFDGSYVLQKDQKLFLDVVQINLDFLYEFGIGSNQIEVSPLCSYEEKEVLHSYRRDGMKSGRSLGVISMVDK